MDLSFSAHPHHNCDVTLVCTRFLAHPTSHLVSGPKPFFDLKKIQYLNELFFNLSFFDLSPTCFHGPLLLMPLNFTALGKQERLICLGFSLPSGPFIYCGPFDNQEMFCVRMSPHVEFALGTQFPLATCSSHLIHPPPAIHTRLLRQLTALSMEPFWGSGPQAKLTIWML